MGTRASLLARTLGLTITVLGVIALLPGSAYSKTITEIIDFTGDGGGNMLNTPFGVAVDGSGNVYVTGFFSHNAFRIDPNGTITEIIDSTGDGGGNPLDRPFGVAVDGLGNVYVTGLGSDNAFKIDANGTITEIIDSTGDGGGNPLDAPLGVAVGLGNVYVTGYFSDNAFKIQFCGDGLPDAGEECDDGNNDDGDGCSADCLVEGGGIPVLPAQGSSPVVVWILGDSNSGGLYNALAPLVAKKGEDWLIVKHSRGASDVNYGLEITHELLGTQAPPDIALITYGAVSALNSCVDNQNQTISSDLDLAVTKILEMRDLYEQVGTTVMLGRGVGVNYRLPGTTVEHRDLGKCLDYGYEYVAKKLRREHRLMANFRLPRHSSYWFSFNGTYDGMHGSLKGYERIARRAEFRLYNGGFWVR